MSIQGIGGGDMRQKILQRLDANGDGALDRNELEQFSDVLSEKLGRDVNVDQFIGRADTNGDGALSVDELRPPDLGAMGGAGRMGMMGQAGDLNPEELLAQIDANGDGEVSAEERDQARAAMQRELQAKLQSLHLQRR